MNESSKSGMTILSRSESILLIILATVNGCIYFFSGPDGVLASGIRLITLFIVVGLILTSWKTIISPNNRKVSVLPAAKNKLYVQMVLYTFIGLANLAISCLPAYWHGVSLGFYIIGVVLLTICIPGQLIFRSYLKLAQDN